MIYDYQKIPMSFGGGLQGNHGQDDLSQQPSHQHVIPYQHHQTPYYLMPSLNTANNNDQVLTNIYNQRTPSSYSLPPLYPSMTALSHTTPQPPPTNHPRQQMPDSSFNQPSQPQEQSEPSGSGVPRIPKSHGDLRPEKQQVATDGELPSSSYTPVAYLNFLSFIVEVKQRLTPEAYTCFQAAFTTFRVTAIPMLSSTPQFANNLHAVRFALVPHHDLLEQLDTLFVQPAMTPLAPKRKRTPSTPCPSSCSSCSSAAVASAPASASTTTPIARSASGDEILPEANCSSSSSAAAATPGLSKIPEVYRTGQIRMQMANLGYLAASVSVMAEAMVGSSGAGGEAGELEFQGLEGFDLRALGIEGLGVLEERELSAGEGAGTGMGMGGEYFGDIGFGGGRNR